MGQGNSDTTIFLKEHKEEIKKYCKKGMSNHEVIELLKTKYNQEIPDTTFRKFKAKLNLSKKDFLQTLLDEIINMKTSGTTDKNIRKWLAEEHEFKVSRATFSRFKKKYKLKDIKKDHADKKSLTKRAIVQKQITDNNIHLDNIDIAIDSILQQQVTDIKTGLENLDKIIKEAANIEIDFDKISQEIRSLANEKNLPRYILDLAELKIRYLELSVKAFEAKNKLFKDEIDRLIKNRILEIEDKRIELSQKDIMKEIEILAKQIDEANVQQEQ